jgi:DNA (cytosine-5)-methyltransferase 1
MKPFSIAGKKKGFDDERSKCWENLIQILKNKKPNSFVLENVKNLTFLQGGTVLKSMITDLENLDYYVTFSVLNCYDFGIPQNRERLFIVGNKAKKFSFNGLSIHKTQISLESILRLKKKVYISPQKYTILEKKFIKKQKKSGLIFCGFMNKNLRKKGVLNNSSHLSRVHKQPNRIYSIKGSCPTLSSSETSCRYYIYDGIGVIKLDADDLYKIMGFPDDFQKLTKKTTCVKQIGNAVCPKLIELIISEMIQQKIL